MAHGNYIEIEKLNISRLQGLCEGLLNLVTKYEARTQKLEGLAQFVTGQLLSSIRWQVEGIERELELIGFDLSQEFHDLVGRNRFYGVLYLIAWVRAFRERWPRREPDRGVRPVPVPVQRIEQPRFAQNLVELLRAAVEELQDPTPPEPTPRLVMDWETFTIMLDGVPYPRIDPDAFEAFGILKEQHALGMPIVPREKFASLHPKKPEEKTLRRWLSKLPPAIRECIKSKPGTGRWLELPNL